MFLLFSILSVLIPTLGTSKSSERECRSHITDSYRLHQAARVTALFDLAETSFLYQGLSGNDCVKLPQCSLVEMTHLLKFDIHKRFVLLCI